MINRFGVFVEYHLLVGRFLRAPAAVSLVVQAFSGSRYVPPIPIAHGNGHIGFLDTGLDLGEKSVNDRAMGTQPFIRV